MTTKWEIICENLQKTLKSGDYKVWISPLTAHVEGNSVHIFTASAYVCAWIERNFASQIRVATALALEIPEPNVQLEFSVRQGEASPTSASTAVTAPSATSGASIASSTSISRSELVTGVGAARALSTGTTPASRRACLVEGQSPTSPQGKGFSLTQDSSSVVYGQSMQVSLPMPAQSPLTRVKWRYDFNDFVVGPTNAMAAAAAHDICRHSSSIETLFVSAHSGLGKTHLIHAIGQSLAKENGHARVGYLTAEDFTSHFVRAARNSQMDEFKSSLRGLDMLLLEDVHHFQGKTKTQDEALATIKSLQAQGSRVVLTSSFSPRELKNVDSQLVSHFCSGMLTQIDKPTRDMCRTILQQKAHGQDIPLPSSVADLLVEHLHDDVRQLESCLCNLIFKARHLNRAVTLDLAMDVLSQFMPMASLLDMERIVSLVCASFNVTEKQITSKSRRKDYVLARDTIYYLARKHTSATLEEIGTRLNRRHSTVVKGISTIERQLQSQTSSGRQVANTVALVERNATC